MKNEENNLLNSWHRPQAYATLLLAVASVLTSGCAGGGSGSGATSPNPEPIPSSQPVTTPAPIPTPTPVPGPVGGGGILYPVVPTSLVPMTGAYATNQDFELTNYRYAHTVEAKGSGVTVAVVDTGVAPSSKLGTRLVDGLDSVGGSLSGKEDLNGHGTYVAGIISAAVEGAGPVGIAPKATIAPIRVLDGAGYGNTETIRAGIMGSASLNARIYNVSLAIDTASVQMDSALDWVKSNGKLLFAAAGNSGTVNPLFPAITASNFGGHVIAVGAIDGNGQIAAYSNAAGTAKDFYLVAPGTVITSLKPGDSTEVMSGTSGATAVASGSAAVIWGLWPYLKATDVSNILFTTAKDLGAAGTDEVYGRGLVDLQAALTPVGTLATVTPQGRAVPVTQPVAQLPNAVTQSVKTSSSQVVYFDGFKRSYSLPLRNVVTVAPEAPQSADAGKVVDQMTSGNSGVARLTSDLSMQGQFVSGQAQFGQASTAQTMNFRFEYKAAGGDFAMFDGSRYQSFAQSGHFDGAMAFAGNSTLKNPYLSMTESPKGFSYSSKFSDQTRVSFGSTEGKSPSGESVTTHLVEARWDSQYTETSVQVGKLSEKTSFLGAPATGVNAGTEFVSVSAGVQVSQTVRFLGTATVGKTRALGSDVVTSVNATSKAVSAGILAESALRDGDQLGLSIALPNRVTKGVLNMSLPVGVSPEGAPVFGNISVPFSSTGREKVMEMAWTAPLHGGVTGLSFARRFQPYNDASARPLSMVAVKWQSRF